MLIYMGYGIAESSLLVQSLTPFTARVARPSTNSGSSPEPPVLHQLHFLMGLESDHVDSDFRIIEGGRECSGRASALQNVIGIQCGAPGKPKHCQQVTVIWSLSPSSSCLALHGA